MTDHSDLIARLRTTRLLSQRNQMALQEEAATALVSSDIRIKELEEALRRIADLGSDGEHSGDRHARCRDIARAALSQEDTPNA